MPTPAQDLFLPLLALACAVPLGLLAHALVFRVLRRMALARGNGMWPQALDALRGPGRMAALLLTLELAMAAWPLPEAARPAADKAMVLGLIALVAWLALALGGVLGLWVQHAYDLNAQDNLHARRMLTKARLFRRLFTVLVAVLAFSAGLMVFDATRGVGASLLASAGIAGAVAGLSAQRLLGAVISGVQIAITQPIRLDDVVVVEGEWGRIEEIGITYVVVRIWDQRRLVLPTTYFLERPIQNWTRSSSELLGTVFVHVDHRAPLPAIRQELERICRQEADGLWDGRVCVLQVTQAGPATIELRALVSAADASTCWDLRCLVRERLTDFLRDSLPEALPRTRLARAEGPQAANPEEDHAITIR